MDPIVRRKDVTLVPDEDDLFVTLGALVEGRYGDVDMDVLHGKLLGKRIGGGSYKNVYTVKGNDDHVLIVNNATGSDGLKHLMGQGADLQYMDDLGIPVMTFLRTSLVGERPVALARRFAGSNRPNGNVIKYHEISRLWSKKTAQDMSTIVKALDRARIYFSDFQVLIDNDGSLVVHDPYNDFRVDVNRVDLKTKITRFDETLTSIASIWAEKEGGSVDEKKREILDTARKK